MSWEPDSAAVEAAASFFQQHGVLRAAAVAFAETNFSKALLFAPFLLVVWYSDEGASRRKVLTTCLSCALALVVAWAFTSTWQRQRPISAQAGCELANRVFMPYFNAQPKYLRWGCFPSDHAAYLAALGLGLLSLRRYVGIACLVVAVFMNGLCRTLVGLHFPSDIVAGACVGALAHLVLFKLVRLQDRHVTKVLADWIQRSPLLQGLLVFAVVEMAVLFRDISFLDDLLFGA